MLSEVYWRLLKETDDAVHLSFYEGNSHIKLSLRALLKAFLYSLLFDVGPFFWKVMDDPVEMHRPLDFTNVGVHSF